MNATLRPDTAKRLKRGFGLVELLTAVSVVAILTAIAVPALSSVGDDAVVRRCQRIAQEYAQLAGNATAAGSTVIADAASVAEVLERISEGITGEGVFDETIFRLADVPPSDMTMAAHHLTLANGVLMYNPREPS